MCFTKMAIWKSYCIYINFRQNLLQGKILDIKFYRNIGVKINTGINLHLSKIRTPIVKFSQSSSSLSSNLSVVSSNLSGKWEVIHDWTRWYTLSKFQDFSNILAKTKRLKDVFRFSKEVLKRVFVFLEKI